MVYLSNRTDNQSNWAVDLDNIAAFFQALESTAAAATNVMIFERRHCYHARQQNSSGKQAQTFSFQIYVTI